MDTKRAYDVVHLELLNGKTIVVKPFSIKKTRLARPLLDKILSTETQKDDEGKEILDANGEPLPVVTADESENLFLDLCVMAMEGQKELESLVNDRDKLEDSLDTYTIYEIVRVATGYDFLEMIKRGQALQEKMVEQGVRNQV